MIARVLRLFPISRFRNNRFRVLGTFIDFYFFYFFGPEREESCRIYPFKTVVKNPAHGGFKSQCCFSKFMFLSVARGENTGTQRFDVIEDFYQANKTL